MASATTQRLAAAGIKVVESGNAPFLHLSVNAVDSGPALGFDVRLELFEKAMLERPAGCVKALLKSWDTAQFGTASLAALGQQLSASVLAVLNTLSGALREAQ